jgi:predicted O-methyltransferase YrrM
MSTIATPIITQIEQRVANIPGWSPIDQLYTLFNLVYLTAGLEGDIVEVGSWCGRSSSILGMAAKLIGNTKVLCVDLFPNKSDWHQNEDGSYSFKVNLAGGLYGGYQEQTVWKEPFEKDIAPLYEKHNGILDHFNETMAQCQLEDIVKTYRGDSAAFLKSIDHESQDFKCKLIFIDGDHSYGAVCQDIKNTEKYLVKGGWICFDDAFSYYDGVNQAITDLVINNPDYELGQQMTRKFFVARKKVIN